MQNTNQMWLDGLYMAGPLAVMFAREFGFDEYYDMVGKQKVQINALAEFQDEKTGLWCQVLDKGQRYNN